MSCSPGGNESTSPLATRDSFHLTFQELRSDLHRALWILGTAIVVAVSGIAAVAVAVVAAAG